MVMERITRLKPEPAGGPAEECTIQSGYTAGGWECVGRKDDAFAIRGLKRFCCVETGIFLILWFWFLVVGRGNFFRDPGVFWHTKVGQQILSTGQIPRCDRFSFTCAGKPWVASQWL